MTQLPRRLVPPLLPPRQPRDRPCRNCGQRHTYHPGHEHTDACSPACEVCLNAHKPRPPQPPAPGREINA